MKQLEFGSPPPKPRITARGVGIAAALWLIYTTLYSLLIVMRTGYPLVWIFPSQLAEHAVLALLSIPIWLLMVRHLDGWPWGRKILLHMVIGPVYSWIGLQLMIWNTGGSARQEIVDNAQWIYFALITLYLMQFTLYHMVRSLQRLRWREQQAAELAALARERELAALKAQINPHFVFNALNSINAMVARDTETTRDMVTQLADLLRYSLDSASREWVTLREEVDFARAYLDLEARRFSDRLDVRYDVDAAALEMPMPPMVLQPLVENAVKHGISSREEEGRIVLQVRVDGDAVEVAVEDTGAGAADAGAASPRGVGLSNTSTRLEMVFGPDAALQTKNLAPHGFRVSFCLPLQQVPTDLALDGMSHLVESA